ncbi:hypothetical protein MBLNU230_g8582t1 [Neophaeotheca triangularis]
MRSFQFSSVFSILSLSLFTAAAPLKRHDISNIHKAGINVTLFDLGEIGYMANTAHPKATVHSGHFPPGLQLPVTVLSTNATEITASTLNETISAYLAGDDVFNESFLHGVYISSTAKSAVLDASALSLLKDMDIENVMLSSGIKCTDSSYSLSLQELSDQIATPPPGPYLLTTGNDMLALSTVYRLYTDSYRDFIFGAYESSPGFYAALDVTYDSFRYSAIPVPSRLYWLGDSRPLAGERVGIKDLYDIKGLQTAAGSPAWAEITPVADGTAPAVQRILDLGGVVVGKQKLAQFASGANPWEWQDNHYPFNPRGDGWQTCSASSSGGGCSIAAYDWLDYAIGSDTGSSMRRPAAVSGTYGQRPSQGMISLERVVPLGAATDTAGVFARDPYKWIKFSKAWYTPELYQSPETTGLRPLSVPDTNDFPTTIIYPTDYFPMANPAAEEILQTFIGHLERIFGMTTIELNFTATVQNISDPLINNFTTLTSESTSIINRYTQYTEVAEPLISAWAERYDGRFPPIDPARRGWWRTYNETGTNASTYAAALERKNRAVEWWEREIQPTTPESCSSSLFLTDIGTGGLPSYREESLNETPDASFLAVTPERAGISEASLSPIYGGADFTVPIGQVPYFSNVTFVEEMWPVSVNLMVRRGCDFVLYNLVEKLADEGVLRAVGTGREAF